MIGANHPLGFARSAQQFMAAVLADVIKSAQDAFTVTDRHDALTLNMGCHVTAIFAQRFFMAKKLPRFMEDFTLIDLQPMGIDISVFMHRQ